MKNIMDLEIIMPAYNEEERIAATILSFYKELKGHIRFRFIISEDGSTDQTKVILERLSHRIPMTILTQNTRQGYSQGVLRALRESKAEYVCCVDSDGQYDPKDFWKLWKLRFTGDVVVGYRSNRHDSFFRVMLSRIFYHVFRYAFPKNIHDPSCSFVLFHRNVVKKLTPILGLTNEGFWWEFMARIRQLRFSVSEQVVRHRSRILGKSQIYSLWSIPMIGIRHVVAMLRVILLPKVVGFDQNVIKR